MIDYYIKICHNNNKKETARIKSAVFFLYNSWKKEGMPLTFEGARLPADAFEEMGDKATYGDMIPVGNFVKIGKSQMIDIYKLCTERK